MISSALPKSALPLIALFFLVGCGEPSASNKKVSSKVTTEQIQQVKKYPAALGKENLWKELIKIADFGPKCSHFCRGGEKLRSYLIDEIGSLSDSVLKQEFTVEIPEKLDRKPYLTTENASLTNIIIRFKPHLEKRLLLGTHYDTRPFADEGNQQGEEPVSGINDGGSGVAVLIGLVKYLATHKNKLNWGVDIVFFDAEELFPEEYMNLYFLGSKHFVETMESNNLSPKEVIIIDMVGDKDYHVPLEGHSITQAEKLTKRLFTTAAENKLSAFSESNKQYYITDDHIAFLEKGIKASLLIDFDYPFRHTYSDNLENCSADSLYQTAKLLYSYIEKYRMISGK